LERLAKTPCNPEFLKQAAMFSALTGVRFSDIKDLKWGDITETPSGPSIRLRIQKTKTITTQPISKEALSYLGERGDPGSKVFQYLEYSSWLNTKLMQWVFDAGITKKIRFHNFRHTYATLLLTAGVDIYTVSKMLGHKDLATTEIYAKLVDEKKRKAAEAIKLNIKP
jgi:integrase